MIKLSYRWRIVDGKSVNFFSDPWVPRPTSFKVITAPRDAFKSATAESILSADGRSWDHSEINMFLWTVDRGYVSSVPCSPSPYSDNIIWHYDKSGQYKVKSGYQLIYNESTQGTTSPSSHSSTLWNSIWSLINSPPKI